MKAIVNNRYGSPDVLHLKEIAKPAPRRNEVIGDQKWVRGNWVGEGEFIVGVWNSR